MRVLPLLSRRPGAALEWRVTIELSGADGTEQTHEVARGSGADLHPAFDPLDLTLDGSDVGWQQSYADRATAPGSGPGRGVLRGAPPSPALPAPSWSEGHTDPAIEFAI